MLASTYALKVLTLLPLTHSACAQVLAQRRPGLARYLRFEDELMAVVSAFLEHVSLASGKQHSSCVNYLSMM